MAPKNLQKLIDRVGDLKAELKDAQSDLKTAVEETALYKAFLDAIKETLPDQVPEKTAAANAYKLALTMLTKKEEDAEQ
jgi:regulator of replication initiation timing